MLIAFCLWFACVDAHNPGPFETPPAVIEAAAVTEPEPYRRAQTADPVYRGMGTDVERWRPLVASYFPADQVDNALCVIRYESGGNPSAKNPSSSARGLFQVLASLWAPHYGVSYDDLYDPVLNTRLAADIWANYGWGAWSAWRKCA